MPIIDYNLKAHDNAEIVFVQISTLVPPVVSVLSKQMLHQISAYLAEQ